MKRTLTILFAGIAALGGATRASAAMSCEELALIYLPDTVVTATEHVPAGAYTPPGSRRPLDVPAMCRLAGTVAPAIQFEVWLPEGDAYNGRFQAVGGGGLAGTISYAAMATALNAGFASASTDTGHVSSDMTWLYDPQRRVDYGYRAIHEMTVKAKAIVDAYYGDDPDYSYFNGCSTGGRQGLMEAQRFPDDYDGIVSGAPVNRFTRLHIAQLWTTHATLGMPGGVLDADALGLLGNAAVAQCDAVDGVKDGIIRDPRACNFDPQVLQCSAGRSDSCLTPAQVHAAQLIYQGPVNPRTGAPLYPGLEPGGEGAQPGNPGWGMLMNGRTPFALDTAVIGGMAYEDPDWDWRTFDFDHDVGIVEGKLYGVLNAINPDLRPFKAHGGKLIIYHGWADPGVMPQQTVDYYDDIVSLMDQTAGNGYDNTADFARLFMIPGMGHCGGGVGTDQADFMSNIVSWVEYGDAPERIEASAVRNGQVTMTRPLCPEPEVAVYRGRGDTNDASNFVCEVPE